MYANVLEIVSDKVPNTELHVLIFSLYNALMQHFDIAINDPAAPLTPRNQIIFHYNYYKNF